MKRLRRNPEKYEAIDLFTSVSRSQGYEIGVHNDIEKFTKQIGESIKVAQNNKNILHGKRVEALFSHVVGALGYAAIVKQEDSGEILSEDSEIILPDYRIILKNGEKLLVEVKNCHSSNVEYLYPIKKKYYKALERYAELNALPIKIAIYYSKYNKWVLLSKEAFTEQKNRYVINFLNAVAKSEMAMVGDRTIATTPKLNISFLCDPEKDSSIDDAGLAKFIIGDVKIHCAGNEVSDKNEINIAFYLMRFGSWTESESEAIMEGGKFRGVTYGFYPECPTEDQEFQFLGELSSMVSSAYKEHTVRDSKVISLDTKHDPEIFSICIDKDYKGKNLPLWQFLLEPNYEFRANKSN